MLINSKIEKMVVKSMNAPNRLKIIFFIIYTIVIFATGCYVSSCKNTIIYQLDDPLEAEYIENDREKQEFIFDVFRYGRMPVSYTSLNADAQSAKILDRLFSYTTAKEGVTVAPGTSYTTKVFVVGNGNTLCLNPVLRVMLDADAL